MVVSIGGATHNAPPPPRTPPPHPLSSPSHPLTTVRCRPVDKWNGGDPQKLTSRWVVTHKGAWATCATMVIGMTRAKLGRMMGDGIRWTGGGWVRRRSEGGCVKGATKALGGGIRVGLREGVCVPGWMDTTDTSVWSSPRTSPRRSAQPRHRQRTHWLHVGERNTASPRLQFGPFLVLPHRVYIHTHPQPIAPRSTPHGCECV